VIENFGGIRLHCFDLTRHLRLFWAMRTSLRVQSLQEYKVPLASVHPIRAIHCVNHAKPLIRWWILVPQGRIILRCNVS
jgi:hypothetical protein